MKYFIYLITVLCLTGCNSEYAKRQADIKATLSKILTPSEMADSKYCIIVPSSGCTGCIAEATKYLKQKIDSIGNAHIIFTGVHDKKLLYLTLGEDFFDRSNIHLDTAKIFQNFEVQSSYPQIIFMENGEPTDIRELDVNERDMSKILKK